MICFVLYCVELCCCAAIGLNKLFMPVCYSVLLKCKCVVLCCMFVYVVMCVFALCCVFGLCCCVVFCVVLVCVVLS